MKAFRLAVLATGLCIAAQANVYDYTEQQIGSGSLGGTTFTNALVTISPTADTSGITPGFYPGLLVDNSVATLTVAGIPGVATFDGVSDVFSNQSSGVGVSATEPALSASSPTSWRLSVEVIWDTDWQPRFL
jgi:hypothetical protein